MSRFMIQLVSMSLQASVAILIVLLLRKVFVLAGVSKKYVMLLWMIPFLLLICPWKMSSPLGLWSNAPSDYDAKYAKYALARLEQGLLQVEIESVEVSAEGELSDDILQEEVIGEAQEYPQSGLAGERVENGDSHFFSSDTALISVYSFEKLMEILGMVWLAGLLIFLAYAAISYLRLKKKVQCCIRKSDNVYCVDDIAVPMVVGIISPRIYLPSGLEQAHVSYVVAHESTHIRRHDPVTKFVVYVIVCMHWFNPLAWLAYHFFEKDMEMACDEETIQRIGTEKKKEYAAALLQLATGTRKIFAVPLAFGEGDTKGRIKNVMKYKKTIKAAAVLAVAACLLVGVVFLTKGDGGTTGDENQTELSAEELAMQEAIEGVREEMIRQQEEVERQELIQKMNMQSELTFDMVREAEAKHILHELDYAKFANGENKKEEMTYSLNYYINFYLTDYEYNVEGEEYRLGVSLWHEDDGLNAIYIIRTSDDDMRRLYSAEENHYSDQLESFLATKESVDNWLTIELPEGYSLGSYNANYGYMGGALILPQVYELYGDEAYAPADWYYAGCISRMPDAEMRYEFVDGKLQEHNGVPWNHTSSECIEVLDLDWQAILMEVNHDLYTAAEMGWLEEDGIDTSEIELTSDYWYFFFVKEGEDTSYYLSLSKKCFTKEEAIAIAETVDIIE